MLIAYIYEFKEPPPNFITKKEAEKPYEIIPRETTDFSFKKIIIYKSEVIIEHLDSYGESIINLFEQAAEENEYIQVDIEKDNGRGSLAFFITRYLGQDIIKKIIKKDISILGKHTKEKGFLVVLILRLIPLVPFDVISYSAGLSEIKYKDFLLATLIGIIPGVAVFSNIGDKSLEAGSFEFYISVAMLIILLAVSVLLKKKISRKIIGDLNNIREENV